MQFVSFFNEKRQLKIRINKKKGNIRDMNRESKIRRDENVTRVNDAERLVRQKEETVMR